MPRAILRAEGNALAILAVAILGAVLGGYAGYLESVFMMLRHETTMTPAAIVNISVLYAAVWAAVGLVVGALGWIIALARRRRPGSRRWRAFLGSLLLSLIVLVLVGGYVNVMYLPTMFARESLLFDAVLLVGCALLWLLIFRLASRSTGTGPSPRVSPLFVATVCLVALLIATALVPAKERGRRVAPLAGASGRLNVLLVLVDATRADHLGCYGYTRETSPNIDRLAGEGIRFSNAYAHAPRTKESTASIMTSLYAATHNVTRLADALPKSAPSLMESMQEAGYRTGAFSANPIVSPAFGFGRGVDHFYCETPPALRRAVLPEVLSTVATTVGRRAGALRWPALVLRKLEFVAPMSSDEIPFTGGAAGEINAALLSWLDAGEGPFFAYAHYMEPHTPYEPPPPYDGLFNPGYEGAKVTHPPPDAWLFLPFLEGTPLPERERANMIAQYDGAIAHFDNELGKLMAELESRGLSDNTLVIVTSDHGQEFYEHHGWGHGHSLYEELIRIPLVLWYPGGLPAGGLVETTVRHVDLMPTILGAAGVHDTTAQSRMEGLDFWPMLRAGNDLGAGLPVLTEMYSGGQYMRALKVRENKVIYTRYGDRESVMLFDLSSDPLERDDLSDERPRLRQSMLGELARMYETGAAKRRETRTGILDEATRERLRALGYVD